MKIEFNFDHDQETYQLKFLINSFLHHKDFSDTLLIINAFAADFSLDPELTIDDLKELIKKAKTDKQIDFVIEISDDGVEYLL